ncbi:MAG TPA: c-type cytochrome [Acidobacteriaceae bacterium]
MNYSVIVTDQGKSTEYQEIPSNQVLVTTTYVPDLSKAPAEASSAVAPTPDGLLAIVRSNCVGCHAFKAKATGPSFAAIAAHDPDHPATTDLLAKYIREGSTGLWGQVSMPPHPDLADEQARAMAQWIEKDAANPNMNEYVGTEGAIRMEAPATPGPNAGLILTASYTASSTDREPAPHGEATVILHGK